jgi:hypothetical protein
VLGYIFKVLAAGSVRMLDRDVARIRADRLREFVRERKEEAKTDRSTAVEEDRHQAVLEATHKIAAYEEMLAYVETKSGERDELISIKE